MFVLKSMAAVILIVLFFIVLGALGRNIGPVERDEGVCRGFSQGQPEIGCERFSASIQVIIQSHGWRCDRVDKIWPYLTSRGFNVRCARYDYLVEDKGGTWIAKLDD